MKSLRLVLAWAALAALVGCERERRQFEAPPPVASAPDAVPQTGLRPGPAEPLQPGKAPVASVSEDDENAFAVAQGKRLFRWYNCNGCHAQGGGNMGPALMDHRWLYGHLPANIYATIVEGRPNGMPAFDGRIPPDQIWQLVAYVRSMSGQLRKDVAPSRADALSGAPPENERDEEKPVPAPPAASTPKPST